MHLHHLIHTCMPITIPPPLLSNQEPYTTSGELLKAFEIRPVPSFLNYISIYSSIFTFCQSRNKSDPTFLAIPAMVLNTMQPG